jgi:hypothetical protein
MPLREPRTNEWFRELPYTPKVPVYSSHPNNRQVCDICGDILRETNWKWVLYVNTCSRNSKRDRKMHSLEHTKIWNSNFEYTEYENYLHTYWYKNDNSTYSTVSKACNMWAADNIAIHIRVTVITTHQFGSLGGDNVWILDQRLKCVWNEKTNIKSKITHSSISQLSKQSDKLLTLYLS